jgi:MYXO-CTERM domain-containing protein
VTVARQPSGPDQTCTVQNGAGTVAGADIAMSVVCTTNPGGTTDAGTGSDAGTSDAGADAGSPCPPGKHLEGGACIVDWNSQVNGTGCASGGAGWPALAGLVALIALAARRRKSVTF